MKKTLQHWLQTFLDAIDREENESLRHQSSRGKGRIDWRVIGVCVVGCVVLSLLEYYGSSSDYKRLRPLVAWFSDVENPDRWLKSIFRKGPRAELWRLSYWSGFTFLGYFLLPVLYIKLVLRERLRDYGLQLQGVLRHVWIYVAMYLVVMPFVVFVSRTPSFQKMYPFYDFAHRSPTDFFLWQAVYALQFFSLEFFFRGFLIHGLRHRFGYYAIVFSVVPYCMIHFGKPMPETLGAIIAGLALGTLSLFSGSIWLGVAIHVSVAVSMDVLSLLAQGKIALPF